MFRTRLISGIVLVLIALVVIITGGPVLAATLFIISEIGVFELYRVLKVQDEGFSPLAAVGYLGTAAYYTIVFFTGSAYTMTVLLATLILCMGVYVFTYPRYRSDQVTGAFFGVVYVAVMLSCIYELRILEKGVYLVWLVFLGSWGCDTCAYCVGKLIGKHKMTPNYGLAIAGKMGDGSHIASFAVICAAGGLISMVGDLAASAIKRNHDIKDYGHLIPGHGGILDRFDSVILIAPVIYYLALALV